MSDPARFSPVVVAPTYDNAGTLGGIVARIRSMGLPIIVVNDGSTDATADVLETFSTDPDVRIVRHERNRGKAAALQSGFALADAEGFTHAVTIDTDGQLDPDEIPRLLDHARQSPDALILGTRAESIPGYPTRSRNGRRVSNLLVRLESGLRVADSQCGFRVYPLSLLRVARGRAARYGFETEILTRIGWASGTVREVPISCRYLPPDEHISHFRPWRDSFRAIGMHAKLMARALMPWPHEKVGMRSEIEMSLFRRIVSWLNPKRAWQELHDPHGGSDQMAAGLAIGVFIGNLPLYGIQTILSLYTARRLHLNPLSVVAGSHVSTPPVGPVLIATAIGVGHWLLHGTWLTLPAWQSTWRGWMELGGRLLLEWSLGAVVVGFVLAITTFLASTVVLRYIATER